MHFETEYKNDTLCSNKSNKQTEENRFVLYNDDIDNFDDVTRLRL